MANSKQSKKRIRQNITKRQRNKSFVSRQRTELKKVIGLLQENTDTNSEEFEKQLKMVISLTDSGVNRKIFHKNKAARIKSRLLARINKQGKGVSHKTETSPKTGSSPQTDSSPPKTTTSEVPEAVLQE